MSDQLYDVLIVGGGPAGLSAALTLYRQLHTVAILDAEQPRNAWQQPTHVLPGWEGRQAHEHRAACRAELKATGLVTIERHEACAVERTAGGFAVVDEQGGRWRSRRLLLAVGKTNVFPAIPGYADNYPERIFHCMFTYGYEHRGAEHAGMLAEGALSSARHAAMVLGDTKKFAKRVTVYTNADAALAETLAAALPGAEIDDRRITQIQRSDAGLRLEMEQGAHQDLAFLVHQPSTKIDSPLVKQLGLRLDERGDICNNPPFFQTDVPGVFVAGDCATPFKIIPSAMYMGANAGAGLARSLAADPSPSTDAGNGAMHAVKTSA